MLQTETAYVYVDQRLASVWMLLRARLAGARVCGALRGGVGNSSCDMTELLLVRLINHLVGRDWMD